MFNLVKMDVYRLIHSKITWVIMVFVIGLAIFSVMMTNSDIQLMQEDPAYATEDTSDEAERTIGIAIWPEEEWATGQVEIGSLVSAETQSGMLLILCAIFTAIFVNAEQKNGYIKNIAGLFPRREKLVLSKATAIAIQVLFMMAVFTGVMIIMGFALWGSDFYMGSVSKLLGFLAVQYGLHLGFSLVMMLLAVLTRSSAFSMTAGILICAGLMTPVYSVINRAVNDMGSGWTFDINKYMLDGSIAMTGVGADADVMMRSVIVGLAFIAGAALLSMVIMKKRDVR